ncbi:uncharacterized protein LOC111709313 [Eurytemora carolleeae]|uniref:uncharacterized protein LOC111709313 n=1 Tax=Eurytemora carolleeae TaxID=1294199 RepID=UPI000C78A372|nr:uncharacterized protein LOC111709313 [Eurytemora carolleeae]|eukprot:XP_023338716.1 uncharacterized protein LOC111709313 [Eurytemora affinis]
MLRLVFASLCLSMVAGAPQSTYPAGLSEEVCPNYPYCGPTPLEVPQVPGAAEVIAAQERVLAQERAQTAPVAPQVPGLAQHAAAEAQVLSAQAQVGTAFTGIVGASGNIGPSGLCGPSGCVAF